MKTYDFFKHNRSSKRISESFHRTFGKKLKLEQFTIDQLYDARNKIRTQLSQYRSKTGFNENVESTAYNKARWVLDAINAELNEREHVMDSKKTNTANKSTRVIESEVQQANTVVTAKTMVDRITRWIEDLSGMENDTLLELGDAIRDEMGNSEAQQFISSVAPALSDALEKLKKSRETVQAAVRTLAGDETSPHLGDELAGSNDNFADVNDLMSDEDDDELDIEDDDFSASDAATGGREAAGRERRESVDRANSLLTLLS